MTAKKKATTKQANGYVSPRAAMARAEHDAEKKRIEDAKTKKPTDRQVAVLLFVADAIDKDPLDRSPSYRDIASRFATAISTAFGHIEALRANGLVYTARDASSGIEVTDEGRMVVEKWREAAVGVG